ncbi:MAG: hypothetical protein HY927_15055 [Elusimicrobia bacterium]|nr:hypothetical protein [Elusimicrobiota bacterium]
MKYTIFGAGIVAFLAYALFVGWSYSDVDEVKGVPKSVRENPGAYREHYKTYVRHHYYGK